ncbi:FAD-binding oxidoreductase [Phytohabitans sp. ZYX-F-186]|uniref:FAD-binding oxidoreductase n=1 Tax=Phytohabitans maris TaxID=3071409 RepID=A0ABU0ZQT5_9ACTN|nr:FAD-binding oxidoreductase [Phytohabitans sp. ZYX-F-186]MDQ7909387.1 FAD-binding oxidoreductase [Phytohabitans sp. ZYX-F-186]
MTSTVRPGEAGYDEERAGFQAAVEHRPDVIYVAESAGDVQAAVEFAAANRLPLAVKATGHGTSVAASGGVLVSTRRMTGVHVDKEAHTASFEAGTRWDQVIEACAPHGLAPLSGSAPHVGAVGYTLGGGLGLLSRGYGFAADSVRGIEVVTPDGGAHHVTAASEPDLFWALRGGRDNFGAVTGLEVDLVPVARLYGGALSFPGDRAQSIMDTYLSWTRTVPEQMASSLALARFPDLPAIPEPLRGKHVAQVRVAYSGDAGDGAELLAPLRAAGPRLLDTARDMPYAESGTVHNDPTEPVAAYSTNVLLSTVDSGAVLERTSPPEAQVPFIAEIRHLGGALARPPAEPSAVGHRNASYLLALVTPLDPSADVDAVGSAHERVHDGQRRWVLGRSLNFMSGPAASVERVREAYEPEDYRRLQRLKARYDPENMFRFNHNIPPAGA